MRSALAARRFGGMYYDEKIHVWRCSGFHRGCGRCFDRRCAVSAPPRKELDEYERLLYSDNEFDDDEDEDTIYEPIETEPAKPEDGEAGDESSAD